MLLRIKLTDADREKYKLPEWVDIDMDNPPLSDIKRLKLGVEMEWADLRNGVIAGSDYANGAAMWIAVRRAGIDVSWDDFDVDVRGHKAEAEVADDPNSSAPDGAKPTSTPSPRSSRASTASTRGRSSSSRARSSTPTPKK